jgi:hypothetical protein
MLIPLVVSKLCPGQEKGTDGRTDRRTDGQGGDYMLPRNFFGEHKNPRKTTRTEFDREQENFI